jgi:hypothetical protein
MKLAILAPQAFVSPRGADYSDVRLFLRTGCGGQRLPCGCIEDGQLSQDGRGDLAIFAAWPAAAVVHYRLAIAWRPTYLVCGLTAEGEKPPAAAQVYIVMATAQG